MDLMKAFATDKRAETEGRKLYLDKANDVWLLIARRGNALYKAYVSKVLGENQTFLNTKTPEAEAMAGQIFKDAAARHLLIGWSPKGIDLPEKKNAAGEVVRPAITDATYSPELSRELFEMDDFDTMVSNFAGEMANYRAEEVIKDAKNSKNS